MIASCCLRVLFVLLATSKIPRTNQGQNKGAKGKACSKNEGQEEKTEEIAADLVSCYVAMFLVATPCRRQAH